MRKTCANCGAEVSEEARFCTSCGSPVSLAEPSQEAPGQQQPSSKTCANCGAEVSEEARFCTSCGSPVSLAEPSQEAPGQQQPSSKTCANCGAEVSEEARFCTSCGSPVSLVKPSQEAPRQEQPSNQQHASMHKALNQRVSTPPPIQPTASMLMYLFADRLFQKAGRLTQRMTVPCKDVMIKSSPLAYGLFAVSFWNLREQGIIRLEPLETKTLGILSSTKMRVIRVTQAQRYGLEGEILNILSVQGGEDDVYSLVRRWFRRDYNSYKLDELVIAIPAYEAMILGYIVSHSGDRPDNVGMPVRRGRLGTGSIHLDEELEPRCEKIATLEGRFNDFVVRWQNFQTTEAEQYALLAQQTSSAINSRTTKSGGADGG